MLRKVGTRNLPFSSSLFTISPNPDLHYPKSEENNRQAHESEDSQDYGECQDYHKIVFSGSKQIIRYKKQTAGVALICQLQRLSPLNTFKQNEISYFLASAI